MSTSTPHFLFTNGGWLLPEIWVTVQGLLKESGFPSTAIPLASVDNDQSLGSGPNESTQAFQVNFDMTEDVTAIRTATEHLADQGEDIIVVMHSYSGQPGSDAMRGLSKADRAERGLPGGVVRLVFIMAYVVPEGFQPAQRDDYNAAPDWMAIDKEKQLTTVSVEDAKRVLYNDLPDAEAEKWANKLRPWSIGCSFSKSTFAGWRLIPSTFVL